MTIKRRRFLQGALAGSTAALLPFSPLRAADSAKDAGDLPLDDGWRVTGSHFGAFRAYRSNGIVTEVRPFELDNNPSDMLKGIRGSIYSSSRIRYPMVRLDFLKNGHKSDRSNLGNNQYVRVTWQEAYNLLIRELNRVQTTYGPWALFAGQTGWRATGQFHSCTNHMQRAMALHGNFVRKIGDYSTGAGQVILPYILGSTEVYSQGTSWELILENADTIILWANDPLKNLQVGWACETHDGIGYLKQLKGKVQNKKIRVISIDPAVTKTAAFLGAETFYVNPLADVAMMLAVAHEMIVRKLYDAEFIRGYTLGFKEFKAYVNGDTDNTPKTPEWAEPICGVSPKKIRELAGIMTSGRTQILMGWSIQRQQHGEQPYWMAAVLAAMIGQIGLPGGGISYGHHYSSIGTPSSGGSGPNSFPLNPPEGVDPIFDNDDFAGYSKVIPVARWIDAILEPGKVINYNGGEITLPDLKMVVISGNNPWHHHQDKNRMKKAFHKLECVVTVDYTWTATCRFSDIIFPACTQFERHDMDLYGSYAARGVLAMQKLSEPLFESRSDWEIWREFSARIGRHQEYTMGRDEFTWLNFLYDGCRSKNKGKFEMPDFTTFWQQGFVDFGKGKPWVRHAEFRDDPEINPLGTPSGLIEIYSRKIARYQYENCKGHPAWLEKAERSHGGPGSDRFPLALQSCHPDQRLHSQLCDSTDYRETYSVKGREPVYMNPGDAKKRGIKEGDLVRVFNDRGQLIAGARVSDRYYPGVVRIHEGAWYAPVDAEIGSIDTYGDPNTLTLDIGTSDLAQCCSAFTCIVEIEKWRGKAPKVTAFGGPTVVSV
ncbi:trimethylamine-N-oxide reductase TorA [Endozoicomonas sp.]|uniref:trimethylamine-N-oxide reductase TorA n=1 Tax=Endozoicomonas sp. TaxID=1892382 RepID=UPI00383B31AA